MYAAMIDIVRRLRRMDADQRALLAEALVLLVGARVGLRVLSLTALRRRLRRPPMPLGQSVARIAWAVNAVGARLTGTTCLVEALAAESMLRRHGHQPTLNLGIHSDGRTHSRLDAHAWVECGDVVVAGRIANLERYAVLS
jgi:Transglutaminase-like superfamily